MRRFCFEKVRVWVILVAEVLSAPSVRCAGRRGRRESVCLAVAGGGGGPEVGAFGVVDCPKYAFFCKGYVFADMFDEVLSDIKAVREASNGKILKVIIETCLLTEDEKIKACELSAEAGADFVKTSTGFSKAGATKEDVALMRRCIPSSMKVKASGGIRSYESAMEMIEAGAERLGCSSGMAIIKGEKSNASY